MTSMKSIRCTRCLNKCTLCSYRRKRMKNLFLAIIGATLMLNPAVSHSGEQNIRGERIKQKLVERLQLTDEQATRLVELRRQIREKKRVEYRKIKAIRKQIKAELAKENPDKAQLDSFAGELGEIHEFVTRNYLQHLIEVKAVLTTEQFEKILKWKWVGKRRRYKHGRKHNREKDGAL
ncbi:MAG: periplasmic heavy metal sensor [Chitinivibrionales bacterium]|nr:periplasmic heavy metal sensor [Chitinivibrionales bacterium]